MSNTKKPIIIIFSESKKINSFDKKKKKYKNIKIKHKN